MHLRDRTHWIFDMDGTLTVPAHDFAWLHAALGVPMDVDILTAIGARPPEQQAADIAFIARWEDEVAGRSEAQADARALLDALLARGCALGVLTRNTREGATRTLAAAGLARYFADADVVSRDCAPPKPHPGGVTRLLDGWGVGANAAVVVGDWVYDAQAGRAAGTATVLVMRHGPQPWDGEADLFVPSLWDLVAAVGGAVPSESA